MHEFQKLLEELKEGIEKGKSCLDIPALEKEMHRLELESQNPEVWKDRERAEQVGTKLKSITTLLNTWITLDLRLQDLLELAPLLSEEQEQETADFCSEVTLLDQDFRKASTLLYLNGPYDTQGAILTVSAGMGGLDAEDFAHMLFRMYLRHAEQQGWRAEVYDLSENEQGGVKSATVEISGLYAYGKLKGEHGVHRLVRLSPFKSSDSRQTSFAGLEVVPVIEKDEELNIVASDLKIDTYRASGAGGQHVNTTDSAVRITHIPTGIVVTCQNERSQLKNRERAMKVLRGKLIEKRLEEEEAKARALKGAHVTADWGNQIRSYVLHPYKQVKDHRTQVEIKNPDSVLDGDLDAFTEGYLEWMQKGK